MRRFTLFLTAVALLIAGEASAKKIHITDNKPFASQFNTKEGTTFIVSKVIDLKKETIILPSNSILLFKKNGQLKNGKVCFNKTHLKWRKNKSLFRDCSFEGVLANNKLYISLFGVEADGKSDDGPLINEVFSIIDGVGCELIFDCDDDYGISSPQRRTTVMVGSNTTVTFKGKGFLKLRSTSKLGAVLSLKDNAHDVIINNVQIDGGGEKVIVGNSGQNGVGAGHFSNFCIKGGIIRNCHKGRDETINGEFLPGDGGKGIQIESALCQGGVFEGVKIENCHAAISCHRNFQQKGGINVQFLNIFGESCEQFAIIHQTNGEDMTGTEQRVVIKNFIARNCGNIDGVFIFSRTRFLTVENGVVEGSVKVPAIFRGRIGKSVIKDVEISQPCSSVIDLNPSTYGKDQRESSLDYFDLRIKGSYDYLITSDTQRKVPYRALTRSLISAECAENPGKAIYRNEVNSSGMLNIKVELPENYGFEGESVAFDRTYGAQYKRLKKGKVLLNKTVGETKFRPRYLTIKDTGFSFWNTESSSLDIWDGKEWVSFKIQ